MGLTIAQLALLALGSVSYVSAQASCGGYDQGEIFAGNTSNYRVTCLTDVAGGVLQELTITNYTECADACDAWTDTNPTNPCMAGVIGDVNNPNPPSCYLKGQGDPVVTSNYDAIIRVFTPCGTVAAEDRTNFTTSGGATYQVRCSVDRGLTKDLQILRGSQYASFEECANACDEWTANNPQRPCASVGMVSNLTISQGNEPVCWIKGEVYDDVLTTERDCLVRVSPPPITCLGGNYTDGDTFTDADGVTYIARCVVDIATGTTLQDLPGNYTALECAQACSDYTAANATAGCLSGTLTGEFGVSQGATAGCRLNSAAGPNAFSANTDLIVRQSYPCNGYSNGDLIVDGDNIYQVSCQTDLPYGNVATTTSATFQACAADCDAFNADNVGGIQCVAGVIGSTEQIAATNNPSCNLKSVEKFTYSPTTSWETAVLISGIQNATCGGLANGTTFVEGGNTYQVNCYTLDYGVNAVKTSSTTGWTDCASQCDSVPNLLSIFLDYQVQTCYCWDTSDVANRAANGIYHQARIISSSSSSSSESATSAPTDSATSVDTATSTSTETTATSDISITVSLPTDSISIPSVSISVPTESISVPTESISVPTESISIPSISVPSVSVSVPTEIVSIPTDSLSLPSISISLPTDVPSISIPSVSVPSVSEPSISEPSISMPDLSTPAVSSSPTDVVIPSVSESIPAESSPVVSTPEVTVPLVSTTAVASSTLSEEVGTTSEIAEPSSSAESQSASSPAAESSAAVSSPVASPVVPSSSAAEVASSSAAAPSASSSSPPFKIIGFFRNGLPGVVAADGRLSNVSTDAAEYLIIELKLYIVQLNSLVRRQVDTNQPIAVNQGVNAIVFTPAPGTISTTFTFNGFGSYISWSNSAFSTTTASFCVSQGFVYAVVQGDTSFCEYPIQLRAFPADTALASLLPASASATGSNAAAATGAGGSSGSGSGSVINNYNNSTSYNNVNVNVNINTDITIINLPCGCAAKTLPVSCPVTATSSISSVCSASGFAAATSAAATACSAASSQAAKATAAAAAGSPGQAAGAPAAAPAAPAAPAKSAAPAAAAPAAAAPAAAAPAAGAPAAGVAAPGSAPASGPGSGPGSSPAGGAAAAPAAPAPAAAGAKNAVAAPAAAAGAATSPNVAAQTGSPAAGASSSPQSFQGTAASTSMPHLAGVATTGITLLVTFLFAYWVL